MVIPLTFVDFSVWLAITSIILLATSEIVSARYGRTKLYIEKKRLRKIAFVLGYLFLFTVMIRVYEIIISIL